MNYETVLANIRTALQEVEQIIQPASAVPYALYSQGSYPYWTNALTVVNIAKRDTHRFTATLRVQAVLHMGSITSGIDGELEQRAQWLAMLAAFTFTDRNNLQCTSFPRGVPGLSAGGLTITQAGLYNAQAANGEATRAIIIDFSLPLDFQISTKG